MHRITRHILWGLAAVLLLPSCVSYQPTATSISDADYNQRISISNPKYKKKHNALGLTFDVGMPVAGAVLGYNSLDPFVRRTDEGRETVKAGGAVLGALIGTGVTYASHAINKYGSVTTPRNKQNWVSKAFGSNYIIIDDMGSSLRVINKDAERNYTVKNVGDVQDFANAFPSSVYCEEMMASAVKNLKRADIPGALQVYPQSVHAQQLKDRYINESTTFEDLKEAVAKYPKSAGEVENLFAKLVKTPLQAVEFHQKYPTSLSTKQVVMGGFSTQAPTADVRKMANAFGSSINLSQADLQGAPDAIRRNYFVGMRDINDYRNMNQLDKFNEQYSWLTFKNKKNELMKKSWELADKLYPKGKDVIAQAGALTKKSYAKKAGVTTRDFQIFTANMLKQEFSKIKVLSTNQLSSKSDEFERWKKSAYSAGLVKTDDNAQYLVYGEVTNESKFDIPVALRATGTLAEVKKIENGGLLGTAIGILGALTGTSTQQKSTIGTLSSTEYIIPCAMAGQTMPYAILIEFDTRRINVTQGGVNLMDLVKVSTQLELENTTVYAKIADRDATREQLTEQDKWLKMAINGLPNAKTIDWFRNQDYKQSTWDAEWSRILSQPSTSSSSSNSSKNKDDDETDEVEEQEEMYSCTATLFWENNKKVKNQKIHVIWESFAFFKDKVFYTDDEGKVVISWPTTYPEKIKGMYIYASGPGLEPTHEINNLDWENGGIYNLNIDLMNSKE